MSALHPHDRTELLEALRIPEGFEFDEAIGTTYSLDLLALLVLPMGFTHMELAGTGTDAIEAEPLKVLEAVRSMAGKLTVLCQAGQIRMPSKHHRLFALLESLIVQATAPHPEGSLHAKTWALRFTHSDGTVRYRFICLSRNLTFDQSWDTIVVHEGDCRLDRVKPFTRSRPLRAFYDSLIPLASQPLDAVHQERLARFAKEIALVDFAAFAPFEDLEFFPMGLGAKPWAPLDRRIDRMFIVSPFLHRKFFKTVAELCEDPKTVEQVVSRPESFDELGTKALGSAKPYTLSVVSAPDSQDDGSPTTDAPLPSELREEQQTLHAKLYLIEAGWSCTLLTGSANATSRAFERNVEFLVGLTGKKTKVGIDAILGSAGDGTDLGRMMVGYTPQPVAPEVESLRAAELRLDRWCQDIAALPWRIRVEPADSATSWALHVDLSTKASLDAPAGCSATLVPAGLPAQHRVPAELGITGVVFPVPGESGVTAFLNIEAEIEALPTPVRRRFTIPAELIGAPEGRLQRVVSSTITQHGGLVEWLFLMLGEEPQTFTGDDPETSGNPGTSRTARRTSGAGLFEELVRAAVSAPERIEAARKAIEGLTDIDQEQPDLPAIRDLLDRLSGVTHAAS